MNYIVKKNTFKMKQMVQCFFWKLLHNYTLASTSVPCYRSLTRHLMILFDIFSIPSHHFLINIGNNFVSPRFHQPHRLFSVLKNILWQYWISSLMIFHVCLLLPFRKNKNYTWNLIREKCVERKINHLICFFLCYFTDFNFLFYFWEYRVNSHSHMCAERKSEVDLCILHSSLASL